MDFNMDDLLSTQRPKEKPSIAESSKKNNASNLIDDDDFLVGWKPMKFKGGPAFSFDDEPAPPSGKSKFKLDDKLLDFDIDGGLDKFDIKNLDISQEESLGKKNAPASTAVRGSPVKSTISGFSGFDDFADQGDFEVASWKPSNRDQKSAQDFSSDFDNVVKEPDIVAPVSKDSDCSQQKEHGSGRFDANTAKVDAQLEPQRNQEEKLLDHQKAEAAGKCPMETPAPAVDKSSEMKSFEDEPLSHEPNEILDQGERLTVQQENTAVHLQQSETPVHPEVDSDPKGFEQPAKTAIRRDMQEISSQGFSDSGAFKHPDTLRGDSMHGTAPQGFSQTEKKKIQDGEFPETSVVVERLDASVKQAIPLGPAEHLLEEVTEVKGTSAPEDLTGNNKAILGVNFNNTSEQAQEEVAMSPRSDQHEQGNVNADTKTLSQQSAVSKSQQCSTFKETSENTEMLQEDGQNTSKADMDAEGVTNNFSREADTRQRSEMDHDYNQVLPETSRRGATNVIVNDQNDSTNKVASLHKKAPLPNVSGKSTSQINNKIGTNALSGHVQTNSTMPRSSGPVQRGTAPNSKLSPIETKLVAPKQAAPTLIHNKPAFPPKSLMTNQLPSLSKKPEASLERSDKPPILNKPQELTKKPLPSVKSTCKLLTTNPPQVVLKESRPQAEKSSNLLTANQPQALQKETKSPGENLPKPIRSSLTQVLHKQLKSPTENLPKLLPTNQQKVLQKEPKSQIENSPDVTTTGKPQILHKEAKCPQNSPKLIGSNHQQVLYKETKSPAENLFKLLPTDQQQVLLKEQTAPTENVSKLPSTNQPATGECPKSPVTAATTNQQLAPISPVEEIAKLPQTNQPVFQPREVNVSPKTISTLPTAAQFPLQEPAAPAKNLLKKVASNDLSRGTAKQLEGLSIGIRPNVPEAGVKVSKSLSKMPMKPTGDARITLKGFTQIPAVELSKRKSNYDVPQKSSTLQLPTEVKQAHNPLLKNVSAGQSGGLSASIKTVTAQAPKKVTTSSTGADQRALTGDSLSEKQRHEQGSAVANQALQKGFNTGKLDNASHKNSSREPEAAKISSVPTLTVEGEKREGERKVGTRPNNVSLLTKQKIVPIPVADNQARALRENAIVKAGTTSGIKRDLKQVYEQLKRQHKEVQELLERSMVTNNILRMLDNPMVEENISIIEYSIRKKLRLDDQTEE